jgi:hypothetical protein
MRPKTFAFATAAFAALGLAASSVQAGITYVGYGTALPTGEKLVTDFNPTILPAGYALGGTGEFLSGTTGDGAAPAYSANTYDTGTYLSVLGAQTETLTITKPDVDQISVYVGSLDTYNTIAFVAGGHTYTYTGAELEAYTGGIANGDQSSSLTNGRFTFSFGAPISSVTFSSSENSFEIADIAANVPEPGTWALMIAGVAMMGAGLRFARRQGVPA